jgi:hypothetical protein
MQRKEDRKHSNLRNQRRKRLEANKSNDLFTSYMNAWYDYVNTCNSMYAKYIRNLTNMTESWLDSFSKFWSVPFGDKVKVE